MHINHFSYKDSQWAGKFIKDPGFQSSAAPSAACWLVLTLVPSMIIRRMATEVEEINHGPNTQKKKWGDPFLHFCFNTEEISLRKSTKSMGQNYGVTCPQTHQSLSRRMSKSSFFIHLFVLLRIFSISFLSARHTNKVEMLLEEKRRGGFGKGNQESLLKDSRSFTMKKLRKTNGVFRV